MKSKKNIGLYLTIGFMVVLIILLGYGLSLNPRDVPSPLINKAAPDFEMPDLLDETRTFSKKELLGKVSLVNVWATWCPSCRAEHDVLLRIGDQVKIYGIDWKDEPEKARNWLKTLGNPYLQTGSDVTGEHGINFGVYGAPETYLINPQGIIIYKHTGPLTWDDWQNILLPKIKEISKSL